VLLEEGDPIFVSLFQSLDSAVDFLSESLIQPIFQHLPETQPKLPFQGFYFSSQGILDRVVDCLARLDHVRSGEAVTPLIEQTVVHDSFSRISS
jgi:hypothetical protein